MTRTTAATRPRRISRKSLFWAATLQCAPLLAGTSCIANGATDQHFQVAGLLWLSIFFWGFGYLYIAEYGRFVLAFFILPVLAMGACSASFKGVNYDFEHGGLNNDAHEIAAANRASIQTGILVTLAVMFVAVDAARLAAARNARADAETIGTTSASSS